MNFWIQASNPIPTGVFDPEDQKLSEATETVFPLMTEHAYMVWQTIYIPLCYKYDLSYMIDDILHLLQTLRTDQTGALTIHWASNTFANVWELSWDGDDLQITSKWGNVLGHTERMLEEKPTIQLSQTAFSYEWKSVLSTIILALEQSGYAEHNLSDFSRLIEEYRALERAGVLYQPE